MRALLARFLREEAGATAIEYAIIAGGLSIVILAAVGGIGANLSGRFSAMSTSLK
ncbi:Flp family type IVb pilin [Bradyrhizobium sp. ORS 86]|uniref:Flp family type IVb pilin n=1 Tax=Bradyrhizobium sp. ORS 86 TaxID=1685970 RepID=UPI00388F00D3